MALRNANHSALVVEVYSFAVLRNETTWVREFAAGFFFFYTDTPIGDDPEIFGAYDQTIPLENLLN